MTNMIEDPAEDPMELVGLADVTRVFFSFPEVFDPARHGDYNRWHSYDHLPQNLALPGVRHGQRWVRTPACREVSRTGRSPLAADLDAAHYAAMYWFTEPAETSMEQWLRLGALTREHDRRPELAWTRRRFMGFAEPIAAAVAAETAVSAGAVPFLPHAGVVLEVVRRSWASGPDYGVRELADVPGVLGAYAFAGIREAADLLVRIAWCAQDPVGVATRWPEPAAPQSDGLLLRTPLEVVVPDEWDWFGR